MCMEYGAHLTLASAVQLRTYQCACYDLMHLQDRLLQHCSVEDMDKMLRHVEADNEGPVLGLQTDQGPDWTGLI